MKIFSLLALSLITLVMVFWTPQLSASQSIGSKQSVEIADRGHGHRGHGGHHGWHGDRHNWSNRGWYGGWGGWGGSSYYYDRYPSTYYYNSYPGYNSSYYYYDPYYYNSGSGLYLRFGF